jgi:GNAT superfamily N-acetyltransferase
MKGRRAMIAPIAELALPPAILPEMMSPPVLPVTLRPMQLADGAAAFMLTEAAFLPDGITTAALQADWQRRWDTGMRAWFGWLHEQTQGNAWVATSGAAGPIVGYARTRRDEQQRIEALTEIFVHPHFQRGQVGKALLAAVLSPAVPDSWRRVIFAHPEPAALALYHRWGTFPLGALWYMQPHLTAELLPSLLLQLASLRAQGCVIRPAMLATDSGAVAWLDRATLGVARIEQHAFMTTRLGGQMLVLQRAGRIAGYGLRAGGQIGPVVGETPADTLALVVAHIAAALTHEEELLGLWVPGANTTILEWLIAADIKTTIAGQATLMVSEPTQVTYLDRYVVTAPPYLI